MIALERLLTYSLRPVGPAATTDGSPYGPRQFWQMCEARLEGPDLTATAPHPGIDWMRVGEDGWNRPDVHVQFVTDDGETILLHYTGLVQPTPKFNAAAESGGSTDWDDQVMRMTMTFDTGAERYRWLTQSLFLAQGRLSDGRIEYAVHRVT